MNVFNDSHRTYTIFFKRKTKYHIPIPEYIKNDGNSIYAFWTHHIRKQRYRQMRSSRWMLLTELDSFTRKSMLCQILFIRRWLQAVEKRQLFSIIPQPITTIHWKFPSCHHLLINGVQAKKTGWRYIIHSSMISGEY